MATMKRVLVLVLAWLAIAMPVQAQPLARLPALGLRADGVTVSGLSSGGYMAGQFAVAYSASVSGVGIVAGGPYGCSHGNLAAAALACSCPAESSFQLTLATAFGLGCNVYGESVYLSFAESTLQIDRGDIDDPARIARQRVWLFTGRKDKVVATPLVDAVQSFYRQQGVPSGQIALQDRADAAHGFPAPNAPVPCGTTASPFLIDCAGFDAAGAMLAWLYPDLPAAPGTVASTGFRSFSQTRYGAGFTGLDASGWVYVPARCERAGAACRLHVVFHGCEQGQSYRTASGRTYGRQFVDGTGYARWAEAGGIVVLFPQVRATAGGTPLSSYRYDPQGCWDFWGYTTDTIDTAPLRFAQRSAPQMKAVKAMVDDLLRSP